MIKFSAPDFLRIPTDDDARYLYLIFLSVQHADDNAEIIVHKNFNGLGIKVSPSGEANREDIIKNLLYLHKHLHIKPSFSKSLKKQSFVYFSVDFENN